MEGDVGDVGDDDGDIAVGGDDLFRSEEGGWMQMDCV
jgi:hypothetical protein